MFTPGGTWIVPCNKPTANVWALIFVRVVHVDAEACGADSRVVVSSIFALLASCMPD